MTAIEIIILLPIYNGITFIDESVLSIRAQTYASWRLIIAVNGHPENSEVYKKALEYKDQRTEVYDFPNAKGKSQTLNILLDKYHNRHIALMDVDDCWEPRKLELQIPHLRHYDVVSTQGIYIGDKIDKISVPFGKIKSEEFFYHNPIINSSAIFNNSGLRYLSVFDGAEDYVFWLMKNKSGGSFYCVPEILVKHRIHSKSAFNTNKYPAKYYPYVFWHPDFPRFSLFAKYVWIVKRTILGIH